MKQFGPNMCEVRGLTQRPGHRGQGSDLRGSLSSQSIDHLHVVVSVSIPFPVEEARSLSHLSVESLKNKTLVPYHAHIEVFRLETVDVLEILNRIRVFFASYFAFSILHDRV